MATGKIERELILEVLLFVFVIGVISLLYENNLLVAVLIIIGWLVGIKFWHKRQDIYFFVMGAIIGPVGEIICIRFGVWGYSNPTFLGIPLWLPLVWGIVIVVIKRTAETLIRIREV